MEISQMGTSEGALEFAVAGDIVQSYVNPSMTSQFAELNGGGVFDQNVLLDVSDVTFLDSNGIGWFVALDSQFRKAGGRLILHSPSPVLQRIFAMMKMTTVITVASSRRDALAAADSPAVLSQNVAEDHGNSDNATDADCSADRIEAGEST